MKLDLDWIGPWIALAIMGMGVVLMTTIAFAGEDEDKIVGHTHDGLPVYESDIPDSDKVDMGKAIGLRPK